MARLLDVRALHAQYGPTKVLHGMDFGVEEGGITTILGANGAGKTTTLRAVCGMVKTQGEIAFAGTRIDGRATESIVRLGVAHVPDGRGTFVSLSVEENLRLGGLWRRDARSASMSKISDAGRSSPAWSLATSHRLKWPTSMSAPQDGNGNS